MTFSNIVVPCLLDSGAAVTVLGRSELYKICKNMGRSPILSKTVRLCGVTGHNLEVLGKTQIEEAHLGPINVVVVSGIRHPMILGRDLFTKYEALIDYSTGTLSMVMHDFPLLPTHANPSLESLGERPPRVVDSKTGQCVENIQRFICCERRKLGMSS